MEKPKCKQKHYFFKCNKLKDMTWGEKIELIEKENYV